MTANRLIRAALNLYILCDFLFSFFMKTTHLWFGVHYIIIISCIIFKISTR